MIAIRKNSLAVFLILFLFEISFVGKANKSIDFDIVADKTGICYGGTVNFSLDVNLQKASYVYSWQILRPSDSNWQIIPNSNSPTLNHSEVGKYRLVISDRATGEILTSKILDITALNSPNATIIATPNQHQICQGESVLLSAINSTGISYQWLKDGVNLADENKNTLSIKTPGEYTLTVSNTEGCSQTSSFRLDYTSSTILVIDPVPTICGINKAPLTLKAKPTGGVFSGQGITDKILGTFDPTTAGVGKHIITYTLASTGGCPQLSEEKIITISDPKAQLNTNTGTNQFCNGENISLITSSGMAQYEWFNNGNAITGNVDKLAITNDGNYSVKVTDSENCTIQSSSVKIEFFNKTNPDFTIPNQICGINHPPTPLVGNPVGGVFAINNIISTELDYAKLGIGKHTIKYTYTGQLTCQNGVIEKEITVEANPVLNLGTDIFLEDGHSVVLKGDIGTNYEYWWSPSSGLDKPNIPNPTASPSQSTVYILKVNSANGCSVTDTLAVTVYQRLYVPTAFSPNGDGQNDVWELINIRYYDDAEVSIFDRWGNTVYYSKGNYQAFDGTTDGRPLNADTYFYKISLVPNQKIFQYHGTVTILR